MDYLAQQFIALASKIREQLSRLNDVIEKHRESIDKAEVTRRKQQQPSPEIRAELHIPQAIEDQRTEQYQQSHRLQRHQVIAAYLAVAATTMAFAAAAVYAYIASKQLREMHNTVVEAKRSNDDANNRFREDQRPYIWLKTGYAGNIQFVPNQRAPQKGIGQILWTFHYTNYGRSPALEVRFVDKTMSLNGGEFRQSYGRAFTVPTPLAPTEENFATVVSRPGVTAKQFARYQATDEAIKVHAIIRYTDRYKDGPYETAICLSLLANGSIAYCKGSYIH